MAFERFPDLSFEVGDAGVEVLDRVDQCEGDDRSGVGLDPGWSGWCVNEVLMELGVGLMTAVAVPAQPEAD